MGSCSFFLEPEKSAGFEQIGKKKKMAAAAQLANFDLVSMRE